MDIILYSTGLETCHWMNDVRTNSAAVTKELPRNAEPGHSESEHLQTSYPADFIVLLKFEKEWSNVKLVI